MKQSRRIAMGLTVTLALLGSMALGHTPAQAGDAHPRQTQPTQCLLHFEYSVHHGPSTGLVLLGVLALQVEQDGRIDTGAFALTDGSTIPVVGQANGRALNLLLDQGEGQRIFGAGTGEQDIRACTGTLGGPGVGPGEGDVGSWLRCCCGDSCGSTPQCSPEVCNADTVPPDPDYCTPCRRHGGDCRPVFCP